MDVASAPGFAFLAMYAEDMHRSSDTGPKLLAPDIDPRLAATHDVRAFLVANDSILSAGSRLQVGPEPLYYGYVAQEKADPQSWIVGVRGTAGIVEWIIDGQFLPDDDAAHPGTSVEHGFWSIYQTMHLAQLDGVTPIGADTVAGIASLVGDTGTVTVVGHSLGSALATYLAFDLQAVLGDRISACLFASPRTGNRAWADAVHAALGERYLVVDYLLDVVPQLPTGPDYATLPSELVIRPSTAKAGVEVEIRSNHHVLCYAAMLSFAAYQAALPGLLPVDTDEKECILGDASTVTAEARAFESAIDTALALGASASGTLKKIIDFG